MPGTLHQGLLEIFKEDPWLAFDILGIPRPVDGCPIDRRGEIQRDGKKPWTVDPDYPDLVLVHRDAANRKRGIVITIEAQKDPNPVKRWMIPVYQANLAEEHRLDAWSVVVSLSKRVSRAIRRWRDGGPPRVDALLLDVETVPKSPWLDDPARRPMAAVLVGALHGYAGDFDAARRAFHLTQTMSGKRRRRHGMTILAALTEEQRNQLIEELPVEEQHDWMDVERRSGTFQFGRKEGREEGRKEGRKEGRQDGCIALRELIFELLAERGIAVNARAKAQIRRCNDLTALTRLARRAAHATSMGELFDR